MSKVNNFVAKHARKFNKAHVHVDRKKEAKKNPPKPDKKGDKDVP